MKCFSILLALTPVLLAAAEPPTVPERPIPRQGLALWLTAEDAVVEKGNVVRIKDRSGKNNDAVRENDPKIVAGNPIVVKHEAAGQPVLRFNGAFCGYAFNSIPNIRTAFMVVSKHLDAFKSFAERFVLGGKTKTEVDFHVGCHWTDVIAEAWTVKKHGKAWYNGFECDPTVSEFSTKLAVLSMATNAGLLAGQLARDRDFKDRSWHGDIAEVILYDQPLGEAERKKVEDYLLKKYAITPFRPVVVSKESVRPGHTRPPEGATKK